MILVDANLLVYAHVITFAQHEPARIWLDSRLGGPAQVGLPWPSLLSFVRLISNPRVFERPQSIPEAWSQVEKWLSCPTAWIQLPTTHHRQILAGLLKETPLRANHIPDAHLAALAIEYGLTLCSTDSDFARFPGVVWQNPLD